MTAKSQRFVGAKPPFPVDGAPPTAQIRVIGGSGDIGNLPTSTSGIRPKAVIGGAPFIRAPQYDVMHDYAPGQAGGVLRGPGGDPQLAGFFMSRFPPEQAIWWHRKVSAEGDVVIAAAGISEGANIGLINIDTIPSGFGVIITSWRQYWVFPCDVTEPTVLASYGPYAATTGRTAHNLLVDGLPVYDAFEKLYDPVSDSTRQNYGFTDLDRNLLEVGSHPTAIYIRDNAFLQGAWMTGPATPSPIPTVVGLELDGWILPNRLFYEVAMHNNVAI